MNHITTPSPRSHAELVHNLLNEMQRSGIAPSDPGALVSRLADGQIIRFSTVTKPRKKNGYLIVHFDRGLPVVAIAGDWSLDTQMMWQAFNLKALTATERRQFREKMERARAKREAELARQHLARSQYAARLYRETQPADEHFPYLKKKGIRPHKARQNGNLLVLPLTDFNGKIWSLQTIDPDGKKRLLAGGRKAGNFIVVDGPDYPARVLICEGWATGCTLAETDSDALVLAAVDAGNLRTVATGARNRWPDADLIVCGDDDRKTPGNPGATAARAAALAAGARFALPEWPPAAPLHLSDFNDLANWQKGAA